MSRTLLLARVSFLVLTAMSTWAAAPSTSSVPPAPHAPVAAPAAAPAPATPAPAAQPQVTLPAANYNANAIEIDDAFASLRVAVSDKGPVTVTISGPKAAVDDVHVTTEGGKLRIREEHANHVWNWHEWFDFHHGDHRDRLMLQITAPKGTSLNLDGFVGDLAVGDLEAPVKVEAAAASGTIGKVTQADISLAGSGKIEVGAVTNQLRIEIAGSGTVNAGASGGASVEVAGSGDSRLGPVLGALQIELAGSGNVMVASVNGPTSVETAGSGSIKIDTGEANPFRVEILGAGDVEFGGEAVDPTISAMGSGNVTMRSYRGKLSSEGMAHIKIGS